MISENEYRSKSFQSSFNTIAHLVLESFDLSLHILKYLKSHLDFIHYARLSPGCTKVMQNTPFISYFYLLHKIQVVSATIERGNITMLRLKSLIVQSKRKERIAFDLINEIRHKPISASILSAQLGHNLKPQYVRIALETEIFVTFRNYQMKLVQKYKEKYISYISIVIICLYIPFLIFPTVIYLAVNCSRMIQRKIRQFAARFRL